MTNIKSVQIYFITVKNLLARQKLAENLVHRQEMPHLDLAEYLIQKQNLGELERLLDRLENTDIVCILEALPNEERQIILQLVCDIRKEEVLLVVPGSVQMYLVSEPSRRARA